MTDVLGATLPGTWSATRLKNVVTHLSRGTAPQYVDKGPVRAISQAANQEGYLDWSRTRFHDYTGPVAKLKGHLKVNDILVNSTGTGTLGRVGYFYGPPDDIPCMADSHVTIIRTDADAAHPRFTYYWLSSQPFQSYIYSALTVGATNQIELNREGLSRAPLPLPPIEEQQRIADFLDAETARIDHLSRLRKRQVDLINERYHVAISELITPGISSDGERHIEWPWLPAKVSTVRLGYIAQVQSGVTVQGSRKHDPKDKEYPYLRVANVQGEELDLSEVKKIILPAPMALRSTLQPGDVVMTEANGNPDNLGRGAVWRGEIPNMVHQNHVFAIRADQRKLLPEYLVAILASSHGRRYFRHTSSQVGIATTSSSKVLNFPIPERTIHEQKEIAERYQDERIKKQRTSEVLHQQLDLLEERRLALITAAVTGQFDVSTASGRGVAD